MILVRLLFLGLLVLGVLLAASGLLVATSGDPIGVLILLPGLVAAAIGWHFAKKYDDENSEELGAVRPPTHNNHEEHLKAGVIIDTDCKTCSEALQNTPHHHEAHLRAGVIYEEGCGVCGREAVERRRVVSQARQPVAPSRRYAPGQSIGGEYKVLGVRPGGMGVVYVVQPRPPRGACVLKTYHQVGDPRIGAAFRREAEAWIRIPPHPNVVGAASVEVLDSTLFVVAEYVPPDSVGRVCLRDYVHFGPLSLHSIARLAAHFCYGLSHAVDNGIWAHRDIKPGNLLVDDEGTLKITDFGLAASVWGQSGQTFFGTPHYASPEQIGCRETDVRSDIYSFGITLYEMQSGRPAFAGSPDEVLRQRQHQDVSLSPPEGPLREVILKCARQRVDERYQSVHQLLEALRAAFKQAGISLPPQGTLPDSRAQALAAKARGLANLGKVREALQAAREWAHEYPTEAPAWTELGKLLMNLGDLEGARIATEKSLSVDDTRSPAWNNLGLIRSRMGDWKGALEALKTALVFDNANTGAMLNMWQPLIEMHQPLAAIDVMKRATAIQPEKASLWVNLASAYVVAGERGRAMECIDRAVTLDPQNARFREWREELKAGAMTAGRSPKS